MPMKQHCATVIGLIYCRTESHRVVTVLQKHLIRPVVPPEFKAGLAIMNSYRAGYFGRLSPLPKYLVVTL